jgi:outer membrane lipoprotein-sorting protein
MKNKIKDVDSYYLSGDLKIYNDKEEYNYDVEVYYKKEDFYRVNLVNNFNSHEQIILKNNDGVYVVTPSLNKSFKFQSNWPNDSSQIYLIESLYKDIISNNERKFQSNDKEYVFEVNANYPNNSNLVKQSIILDKDYNIKNVKVFNGDSEIQMSMTFNEMTLNKEIEDSVFDLNNIITNMNDENNSEDSVGSINDIIYPLYIPSGTVLTSEEKVSKGEGERIILTFDGEKPFILVEETVDKTDEFLIVPTYGEPYLMMDTVATLSNNSISWVSDGIEYYIVSDVMSQIELVEIASSITKIEYNK